MNQIPAVIKQICAIILEFSLTLQISGFLIQARVFQTTINSLKPQLKEQVLIFDNCFQMTICVEYIFLYLQWMVAEGDCVLR